MTEVLAKTAFCLHGMTYTDSAGGEQGGTEGEGEMKFHSGEMIKTVC